MKERTLLIYNSVNYLVPFIKQKGIDVDTIFRDIPKYLKILRKIHFLLNLPFKNIWFNKWSKNLDSYNKIVFFSTNPLEGLKYIKKEFDRKLIFWYWNPIKQGYILPQTLKDLDIDVWTFDNENALKYSMNLNTTFYLNNITLPKNVIQYDVAFVGLDKGRRKYILELESVFNKNNLISYLYIVDNDGYKKGYSGSFPYINYKQYLDIISKSKAVLDIYQEGQVGLSLRPMESIFFKKKLITDNLDIVNHNFYNPNNIFVIGKDDPNKLNLFINTPYQDLDQEIVDKYDILNWLKRF